MAPSLYERLTPAQIADIKLRYENDRGTLAEIAAEHRLLEWHVSKLRARFGWASRRARQMAAIEKSVAQARAIEAADRSQQAEANAERQRAEAGEPAPCARIAAASAATEEFDADALVRDVRRTIEKELAALGGNPGREDRMRMLVQMTRALRDLHTLQREERGAQSGQRHEDSTIDIAQLRRELSRKLDDLRGEGEAAGADRTSEP